MIWALSWVKNYKLFVFSFIHPPLMGICRSTLMLSPLYLHCRELQFSCARSTVNEGTEACTDVCITTTRSVRHRISAYKNLTMPLELPRRTQDDTQITLWNLLKQVFAYYEDDSTATFTWSDFLRAEQREVRACMESGQVLSMEDLDRQLPLPLTFTLLEVKYSHKNINPSSMYNSKRGFSAAAALASSSRKHGGESMAHVAQADAAL